MIIEGITDYHQNVIISTLSRMASRLRYLLVLIFSRYDFGSNFSVFMAALHSPLTWDSYHHIANSSIGSK